MIQNAANQSFTKFFCACIFSNINILVPRTTNFRNFFLLNAYLSDLVGL